MTDVARREDALLEKVGPLVQERADLLVLIARTEKERDLAIDETALYRTYVNAANLNPAHV